MKILVLFVMLNTGGIGLWHYPSSSDPEATEFFIGHCEQSAKTARAMKNVSQAGCLVSDPMTYE